MNTNRIAERLSIRYAIFQALEEGVKAVSLFWGDPAPYLRKAKDAGAVVMQTVATPEEARRARARRRRRVARYQISGHRRIRRARRLQATSAESRRHRYGVYEIVRSRLAGRAASGVTKFNSPDVEKRRLSDHGKTTSRGRDRRGFPQWRSNSKVRGACTDAGCNGGN